MIIGVNDKGCDSFNTPSHIFNQLNRVFNFTVDVACDASNAKCSENFAHDRGFDGLSESWKNQRVFCNPPFSTKKDWILKAVKEVEKNGCPICVMILPLNCMSIEVFQDEIIDRGYKYHIPKKRIHFLDNKTKLPTSGNNSGTVIVYFMKNIKTSQ